LPEPNSRRADDPHHLALIVQVGLTAVHALGRRCSSGEALRKTCTPTSPHVLSHLTLTPDCPLWSASARPIAVRSIFLMWASPVSVEASSIGRCHATEATKFALSTLGRRVLDLEATTHCLDDQLAVLVRASAPGLLALDGVGVDTAAIVLVAAGDNPHRLRNEAAFAHLCGVARSKRLRARSCVAVSTAVGTVKPTMRCGASCSPA
jgi:hypothetical protein